MKYCNSELDWCLGNYFFLGVGIWSCFGLFWLNFSRASRTQIPQEFPIPKRLRTSLSLLDVFAAFLSISSVIPLHTQIYIRSPLNFDYT